MQASHISKVRSWQPYDECGHLHSMKPSLPSSIFVCIQLSPCSPSVLYGSAFRQRIGEVQEITYCPSCNLSVSYEFI